METQARRPCNTVGRLPQHHHPRTPIPSPRFLSGIHWSPLMYLRSTRVSTWQRSPPRHPPLKNYRRGRIFKHTGCWPRGKIVRNSPRILCPSSSANQPPQNPSRQTPRQSHSLFISRVKSRYISYSLFLHREVNPAQLHGLMAGPAVIAADTLYKRDVFCEFRYFGKGNNTLTSSP